MVRLVFGQLRGNKWESTILHSYSGEQLCHGLEGGSVGNVYSNKHHLQSLYLSIFNNITDFESLATCVHAAVISL